MKFNALPKYFSYRVINLLTALFFTISSVFGPAQTWAQIAPNGPLNLPAFQHILTLTSSFQPPIIKGLTIYPENPFQFDFIIDTGEEDLREQAFKDESVKLVKYFLAALTIPEEQMWVNLAPYDPNRVIPPSLGETAMGRDMLVQDYWLKQLSASLMYPENELGKKFWANVSEKMRQRYGAAVQIPMSTFNKIWIIPQDAKVYEHETSVFVINSHLKVMLEEDYQALNSVQRNIQTSNTKNNLPEVSADDKQALITTAIREILIPEIEKEVNEGKYFANLRQIYNSMILATWYKVKLKESILGKAYVDQVKTRGVDIDNKDIYSNIYNQYLETFRKGVYDYIKEEYDPATQSIVSHKYFSGGLRGVSQKDLAMIHGEVEDQNPEDRAAIAASSRSAGRLLSVTTEIIVKSDKAMLIDKKALQLNLPDNVATSSLLKSMVDKYNALVSSEEYLEAKQVMDWIIKVSPVPSLNEQASKKVATLTAAVDHLTSQTQVEAVQPVEKLSILEELVDLPYVSEVIEKVMVQPAAAVDPKEILEHVVNFVVQDTGESRQAVEAWLAELNPQLEVSSSTSESEISAKPLLIRGQQIVHFENNLFNEAEFNQLQPEIIKRIEHQLSAQEDIPKHYNVHAIGKFTLLLKVFPDEGKIVILAFDSRGRIYPSTKGFPDNFAKFMKEVKLYKSTAQFYPSLQPVMDLRKVQAPQTEVTPPLDYLLKQIQMAQALSKPTLQPEPKPVQPIVLELNANNDVSDVKLRTALKTAAGDGDLTGNNGVLMTLLSIYEYEWGISNDLKAAAVRREYERLVSQISDQDERKQWIQRGQDIRPVRVFNPNKGGGTVIGSPANTVKRSSVPAVVARPQNVVTFKIEMIGGETVEGLPLQARRAVLKVSYEGAISNAAQKVVDEANRLFVQGNVESALNQLTRLLSKLHNGGKADVEAIIKKIKEDAFNNGLMNLSSQFEGVIKDKDPAVALRDAEEFFNKVKTTESPVVYQAFRDQIDDRILNLRRILIKSIAEQNPLRYEQFFEYRRELGLSRAHLLNLYLLLFNLAHQVNITYELLGAHTAEERKIRKDLQDLLMDVLPFQIYKAEEEEKITKEALNKHFSREIIEELISQSPNGEASIPISKFGPLTHASSVSMVNHLENMGYNVAVEGSVKYKPIEINGYKLAYYSNGKFNIDLFRSYEPLIRQSISRYFSDANQDWIVLSSLPNIKTSGAVTSLETGHNESINLWIKMDDIKHVIFIVYLNDGKKLLKTPEGIAAIKELINKPTSPIQMGPYVITEKADDQKVYFSKPGDSSFQPKPITNLFGNDRALLTEQAIQAPGGIDLNGMFLNLNIERDTNGLPLPANQQPMLEEFLKMDGLLPVILRITPVNMPLLLGVGDRHDYPLNHSRDPQEYLSLLN